MPLTLEREVDERLDLVAVVAVEQEALQVHHLTSTGRRQDSHHSHAVSRTGWSDTPVLNIAQSEER